MVNAYAIAYKLVGGHEGKRNKVYFDTKQIATIGRGRNLTGKGLSDDEVDLLFRNDLNDGFAICRMLCPTFDTLTPNRQAALVDMSFQGEASLRGFKKMFSAIARQDWAEASKQAKDSKWYLDVGPLRGDDVANLLLKG